MLFWVLVKWLVRLQFADEQYDGALPMRQTDALMIWQDLNIIARKIAPGPLLRMPTHLTDHRKGDYVRYCVTAFYRHQTIRDMVNEYETNIIQAQGINLEGESN
jgi:hypothetical protein